jgi:hypothetical protein
LRECTLFVAKMSLITLLFRRCYLAVSLLLFAAVLRAESEEIQGVGGLLQIRCICSKRRFRPLAEESSAAVVETRARRLYLPCKYRRDRSGLSCSHPASAAP